jgi:hypothetical protein
MNAKNYEFEFRDKDEDSETDFSAIKEKLDKKFKKAGGSVNVVVKDNKRIFVVQCDKIRQITSEKQFKVKGRIPIIRNLSYEIRQALCRNPRFNHSILQSNLNLFLTNPNEMCCKTIANELKNIISNVNLVFYSEYVMSSLLFAQLVEVGMKTEWAELKIFSLDSKMEELVKNLDCSEVIKNFRCDLVLIKGELLFIFEYKYR